MLLSVKRVLENRAKPSRYSQARSGMYYVREGKDGEEGEGVNASHLPLLAFAPAVSSTGSVLPSFSYHPSVQTASNDSTPSLPGVGGGEQMQKGTE